MVYLIVYYQKAVVCFLEYLYMNGRVLRIMFGYVQLELLGNIQGIYGCINAWLPFVQHGQHCFIYVVIYKQDSGLGTFDKSGGEFICLENLPIVENASYRRKCGFYEEINLLFCFSNSAFQLL